MGEKKRGNSKRKKENGEIGGKGRFDEIALDDEAWKGLMDLLEKHEGWNKIMK